MSFKNNYIELTKKYGGPYSLVKKGIKKGIIESIMQGSMPSLDRAYIIAQALGVSLERLLTGRETMPEVPEKEKYYELIPHAKGALSGGQGTVPPGELKGWLWIPKKYLPGGGDGERYAAVTVSGESMEPLLVDGETVVIDRTERDLDAVHKGSLYAVGKEGLSFVKKLEYDKDTGMLFLISENRDHVNRQGVEYIRLKKGMENPIMGKVVFSFRRWK